MIDVRRAVGAAADAVHVDYTFIGICPVEFTPDVAVPVLDLKSCMSGRHRISFIGGS
jgi:hypothetical protein